MEILGNSTNLNTQLSIIDSLGTSQRQQAKIMEINDSKLIQNIVNTDGKTPIPPFDDMIIHRFFFNADAQINCVEHRKCSSSVECSHYDKLLVKPMIT